MTKTTAKQQILEQIRCAKQKHTNVSALQVYPNTEIYKPIVGDELDTFKSELEQISGQVHLFDTTIEVIEFLKKYEKQHTFKHYYLKESKLSTLFDTHQISYTSEEDDLLEMEVGVSTCECLISRTGGVLFSTASLSGRRLISYPPVHIVLAHSSQIVTYPTDAYLLMSEKYKDKIPSQITIATGPSRTADIEKTLVLGAHGPKEMIVVICKEKSFINFVV